MIPGAPTLPDLAALRRSKKLTLEAISFETRINRRYLEAIEHGEYDRLPGGVYTISYIRQYAAALGCDPADLLASYYDATGCDPKHPFAPPVLEQPPASHFSLGQWLWSLIAPAVNSHSLTKDIGRKLTG